MGSGPYTYNVTGDGSGVDVYIVDTGISGATSEFQNRILPGFSYTYDKDYSDSNGHSTNVAGIIGSKTYGVAKKTNLIPIKTFNNGGIGYESDIVNGINWIVGQKKGGKWGVINMSYSTQRSEKINCALDAAVDKGLIVVAAAGNDEADA